MFTHDPLKLIFRKCHVNLPGRDEQMSNKDSMFYLTTSSNHTDSLPRQKASTEKQYECYYRKIYKSQL